MIPEEIRKQLGRMGIWAYVKKKYYIDAILYLKNKFNEESDETREKEVIWKEFKHHASIAICDYSHEPFEDNDLIVCIWRVKIED